MNPAAHTAQTLITRTGRGSCSSRTCPRDVTAARHTAELQPLVSAGVVVE
jgi:hypothetical protein